MLAVALPGKFSASVLNSVLDIGRLFDNDLKVPLILGGNVPHLLREVPQTNIDHSFSANTQKRKCKTPSNLLFYSRKTPSKSNY